ncbi:MAG: hypothetical protein PUP93_11400 [Rhizonema sp. NSF051]|nr:hypothetical protein [Rhizonema sp. NSF051]
MWIKTHEVNQLQWEESCLPFGVSRAYTNQWVFGVIPKAIGQKIFEQVKENSLRKSLNIVARDKT